ncbi:hypothetical protein M3Y99_00313700 [Aphelenchoides fujianensis]|nr:hypothetical protein M3Y99_00313700 [Aphelenchoides fujianensis]
MSKFLSAAIAFLLVFSLVNTSRADTTGIISCVLCEMIAEPVESDGHHPAFMVGTMYKWGLMGPLCNQLVDQHAKLIVRLQSRNALAPHDICLKASTM